MVDPRIKAALEWKLMQLAFEFQSVPVEEVHDMISIAWQFAPDTLKLRDELPKTG